MTLLVALASGAGASASATSPAARCNAAVVHYTPWPGGDSRLDNTPWVRGSSGGWGLVGLLWYWPQEWRAEARTRAVIYTGGQAPQGYSTKVLWAFTSRAAVAKGGGTLVVRGQRLGGRGRTVQRFAAISYDGQNGAPSYASIIKLPSPGCWRLSLSTGVLRASVVFQAIRG